MQGFLCQETYWLLQDWPAVFLHVARATIALIIILTFKPHTSGSTSLSNVLELDSTFFQASGKLTEYAYGVLLTKSVHIILICKVKHSRCIL